MDAPLHADNVEEHVHLRQVNGHREQHHDELVLHVNGGAALDDEVKHVHVAEDHGDVGDRVAVQKRN